MSYSPSCGNVYGTTRPPRVPIGQAIDVLLLREVRCHAKRLAARHATRPADREPADLLRGRHVALEQRRRQLADRDVVEPVARFVGRQERGNVHVEREQVADGVAVLGTREPADRRGAARIRPHGRRAIERRLEGGNDGIVGGFVRTRLVDRRHLPRAQLPDDLLPLDGMHGDVTARDRFERQACLLRRVVVAVEAVLLDERAMRRDGGASARDGGFDRLTTAGTAGRHACAALRQSAGGHRPPRGPRDWPSSRPCARRAGTWRGSYGARTVVSIPHAHVPPRPARVAPAAHVIERARDRRARDRSRRHRHRGGHPACAHHCSELPEVRGRRDVRRRPLSSRRAAGDGVAHGLPDRGRAGGAPHWR